MFAFLNVITGFFCENAFDLAEQDKEHVVQEQLKNKAHYCHEFEALFVNMDEDKSGELTLKELSANLDSEELVAYFNHLNLDVIQAWEIFQLLDVDNSGTLSLPEFVEGCLKLRGPAKKVDIAEVRLQIEQLSLRLGEFMIYVQHCFVAVAEGGELPVATERCGGLRASVRSVNEGT
jgi:Ca2+-binding EF-hand superfamily protein